MSTICVVAARVSSTRLPGKVIADVDGRPLLDLVLRRLASAAVDRVVVATTQHAADDPVAEIAERSGVAVVRGSELDVLGRFALVLDRFDARTIVRVTADCPFVDPAMITRALEVRDTTGADYVSNTLVRTFPDGLDVEVIDSRALELAAAQARDPVEREHVTPFIYRRPERFVLRSFRGEHALGDLRWTVDTAADLEFVRGVVARLGCDDFTWEDVLSLVGPPAPHPDGWSFTPATADDGELLLAFRNDPDSVRWSRSGRAVERDEHAAWFAATLENPSTRVWIAAQQGDPVGQARVDVRDGVGTVSIAVARSHRGRGAGTRVLHDLMSLDADEQVHTLVAWIHARNEASRRLFAGAGFREWRREGDFAVTRWERPGRA